MTALAGTVALRLLAAADSILKCRDQRRREREAVYAP